MEKCIFRIAQPADAEHIQRLYLELVQDANIHVRPESIAALAHDEFNSIIVGEMSGQILATAFMAFSNRQS